METERRGQRAATRGTPRVGAGFSVATSSNREVEEKATTRAERATSLRDVGKMGSSKGKQLTAARYTADMNVTRTSAHVGFDVGATSMRIARITADGVGEPRKVATPRDVQEGVALLVQLIRESAESEPLAAVAGGVPAVVSEGRIYRVPNQEGWTNFNLRGALLDELGVAVEIHNDADMAALGEATYGAGAGTRVVAYIGVGTGIGTARVVEGRIDSGAFDLEAGHHIIEAAAGKSLEELVSGGAFSKRFGVHPRDVPRTEYEHETPMLAVGIYNTILHWSPEVVVLGGSMMNEENGYRLGDVVAALEKLPAIYPKLPELRPAALHDNAGLHGARALLFGN
ncbi:ROK family protein [Candidatus Kaiserbacteria bacterium]|nr:ROK family protein [Candidatus Kaiserbacteria bacterium]